MACLPMMYGVDLEMVADIFMAFSLLVPLKWLWNHSGRSSSVVP